MSRRASEKRYEEARDDDREGRDGGEAAHEVLRHQTVENDLLFFVVFGGGLRDFVRDQIGRREAEELAARNAHGEVARADELPEGKDILTAYIRPWICKEYDL